MRHLFRVYGALSFLLIFTLPAFAVDQDDPGSVTAFFAPLRTTVVMQVDSGVLVDKGAEDGMAPGDVLAVVEGEKQMRDPRSGKVLDTLVEYKGYLVAERVKADISYCRVAGPATAVREGAEARRFENVPVYFEDPSGQGFPKFQQLRRKLPHLLWKDYLAEPLRDLPDDRPILVIRYRQGRFTVLNERQKILFVQQDDAAGTSGMAAAGREAAAPPSPAVAIPVPGSGWRVDRLALPVEMTPQALRAGDLDRDGRPEIVIGFERNLLVCHLGEERLTEIAGVDFSSRQQLVAVSILDLDGDGRGEVIVSLFEQDRAKAMIFAFADGRLTPVADAPMLLAAYRSSQGENMLVGIGGSAMLDADPQFFRANLADGRLSTQPIHLPGIHQPFGVTGFADASGTRLLASLTDQGRLRVNDDKGQVLWESADKFGGSTRGVKIPQPGQRRVYDYDTYFFHSRLTCTPEGTLLVSQHDGPGPFKNYPNYQKGRLVELKWDGAMLEAVSRTRPLGGMIVDFDQVDLHQDGRVDLLAAVVYRKQGVFTEPAAGLVVLTPSTQQAGR